VAATGSTTVVQLWCRRQVERTQLARQSVAWGCDGLSLVLLAVAVRDRRIGCRRLLGGQRWGGGIGGGHTGAEKQWRVR
jgi:hypothetical protein